MMRSIDEIAKGISNIRYDGMQIAFDVGGITHRIKDPVDVLLVGYDGAAKWLAKHYGYLIG